MPHKIGSQSCYSVSKLFKICEQKYFHYLNCDFVQKLGVRRLIRSRQPSWGTLNICWPWEKYWARIRICVLYSLDLQARHLLQARYLLQARRLLQARHLLQACHLLQAGHLLQACHLLQARHLLQEWCWSTSFYINVSCELFVLTSTRGSARSPRVRRP